MKAALLILIARFCLPLSSLANEFINDNFFNDKIANAAKELAVGSEELDRLNDFSFPEIDGVLETIRNSSAFLKRKSMEFKNAIEVVAGNMGDIIENLLELTFLYVSIFLIQVIILPLLSFFFLFKIINTLFYTSIPNFPGYSKPSIGKNNSL